MLTYDAFGNKLYMDWEQDESFLDILVTLWGTRCIEMRLTQVFKS